MRDWFQRLSRFLSCLAQWFVAPMYACPLGATTHYVMKETRGTCPGCKR
jgi:hypothetical protein